VSFSFQILGLFISYMVMCICFGITKNRNSNNKMFKKLVIINFISQFLYLLGFIILSDKNNNLVGQLVVKLFMGSILIFSTLLFGYIYSIILKERYSYKDSIYNKRFKSLSRGSSLINMGLLLVVLMLSVEIDEFLCVGNLFHFVYIVSLLFSILSLIILILNIKKISRRKYFKLYVPIFISLVVIIVQYFFYKLGIIASFETFVVLFIYLALENSYVKENYELKIALESANEGNIDKALFLERVSREIRMPLNTIDGFSQVIMDEDNIDNVKEDIKDIRVASNNLVDMVNGLMDISLIEAGKMEVNNHDYDTVEMLDSVCMMAKTLINKKNIELKIDYSASIPRVLNGDSEKIKRILINLFRNAVNYTEKGHILFKVSAVSSGSVCRLVMSVSDTGKGIKKEDLNKIFNHYEKDINKKTNGLGLAICNNLINLMNGKIDVSSEEGRGSEFTVVVDQKIIQADSIKITKNNEVSRVKIFDASDKRVLLVDDNKLNLKVASRLLKAYNVSVIEATSGREFLEIIDMDSKFDLILMDDMMPKMSGTETLEIFKKISRVSGIDIPVVVLTANAISGMREKYLKAGFDDYLAKPIDKYELNRVLKKFLKN